jgi:Ni,Fe-hydrogenase III small subunit/formate hydrogenlyase subunit 6/NADH:ubiquinone oxidoreductase subunit I
MFDILRTRFSQGRRTIRFPGQEPALPDRFRGLPIIDRQKCAVGCDDCVQACPTRAIKFDNDRVTLNVGRCLFCTDCSQACPEGAVSYSQDYKLAVRNQADLVIDNNAINLAQALDARLRQLFGRSLKLRQVSAGGCNACEADVNVLNTIVFDLARFGIQFVASPRHAGGLLITGPVTENMRFALQETYDAVPTPKIVIAVGACAISGGPYLDHPEQHNGADALVPVDLYVPGCPPHPLTILHGLLSLLGRFSNPLAESAGVHQPTTI